MTEETRWPDPVYLTKDHAINMTMRDYFAAKALQGLLAEADCFWDDAAPLAYQYADAMLRAREK